MKGILTESGLRNIKELSKRYKKAKIYYHQDLDGITSALGMKNYLERNGIEVVDCEIIQYGDKEFAIKKADANGDVMPVLVDFAHGKPMFVIHTDHHDSQAGAEDTGTKNFRQSRSNIETISQVISPSEIFPDKDVKLISIVDSADFAKHNITVDMVMNYIYKYDKSVDIPKNKLMLGLVTNKLLLAYKNKPGFLDYLVMNANPSLMSIFQTIVKVARKKGYAKPEDLEKNKLSYINQMKESPNVRVVNGVIVQYGGGKMFDPGSYDRYTPFKNNPEADFLVIAWPMGLVQASCNPFKNERQLKGVNLGEIAIEVMSKWEDKLKEKFVPVSTIKWVSESGRDFNKESVGFTYKDLIALYGESFNTPEGFDMSKLNPIMSKPFSELSEDEMLVLDQVNINTWDLIMSGSGGHKCITNLGNLNYLGRKTRPPKGTYRYNSESEDSPSVKFTKMVQTEFVRVLLRKIEESNI